MLFYYGFKPYIAVIGDMIDSRKLNDRHEIQLKLQKVLDDVNTRYSGVIASKFMITLGDEFQGLLENGKNVLDIITDIEIRMYPAKIRFGVGIGKIETNINPNFPFGADGPAYHKAREMVVCLKNMEKRNKNPDASIMIASEGDHSDLELLLNTILSLCTTIQQKWTDRQREIVYDCLLHGDNQKEAAMRLGINQPSVQKAMSNADYYTYKRSLDVVSGFLAEIKEDRDV